MADRLFLRCSAGEEWGIGHLRRCLAIAGAGREQGYESVFLLPRDPAVREMILRAGFDVVELPDTQGYEPGPTLEVLAQAEGRAALLLDVSNRWTRERLDQLKLYQEAIQGAGHAVVMIDSLFEECLASHLSRPLDGLVIPYIGFDRQDGISHHRQMAGGASYFVLASSLCESGAEAQRWTEDETPERVRSVLITTGGSDPFRLSEKYVDALNLVLHTDVSVRLVQGPLFSGSVLEGLEQALRLCRHDIEVVVAPDTLRDQYRWCELALIATGLTKYELAYLGRPSIQLADNNEFARVNKPFAESGSSLYLGTIESVSQELLSRAIEKVIDDRAARLTMSLTGVKLMDGQGATRIVEIVKNV